MNPVDALEKIQPEGWKALHAVAVNHRKANPGERQRLFNAYVDWLYDQYVGSLELKLENRHEPV